MLAAPLPVQGRRRGWNMAPRERAPSPIAHRGEVFARVHPGLRDAPSLVLHHLGRRRPLRGFPRQAILAMRPGAIDRGGAVPGRPGPPGRRRPPLTLRPGPRQPLPTESDPALRRRPDRFHPRRGDAAPRPRSGASGVAGWTGPAPSPRAGAGGPIRLKCRRSPRCRSSSSPPAPTSWGWRTSGHRQAAGAAAARLCGPPARPHSAE